ncbi:MAG: phosphoribosylglycinamide synthetase C domain-containing protein [Roseiflexaceae bacterium]|nr:phosphoribosylglycinamide synthetase C domain-containing protein [Roseiflexaceae bacterium]
MKVLILGNDGRAHVMTWKLLNSSLVQEVVCAPGNGGTAQLALHADLDQQDSIGIARWCFDEQFDLVFPTNSTSLQAGLVDETLSLQVGVCGPPQRTVALEQSRCQAKEFMLRHRIPTAPGRPFNDLTTAEKFLASQPLPVMIKADHSSGGEQVYIDRYAALEGLRTLFAARPLDSNQSGVVIEAFLPGARVALSAFTDGRTAVPLLPVRLYDRAEPSDTAPIAVGVGAHTSSSNFSRQLAEYLQRKFLQPFVDGLAHDGLPSWGILGIDCIIAPDGPRAIGLRYALREGEAQVVLPRLEDDLMPWIQAMFTQRLHERPPPVWSPTPNVGLGLFARGYPISFAYGGFVQGLEDLDEGVLAFHSSTAHPGAVLTYTPQQNRANLNQTLGRLFGMTGLSTGGLHSTGGLVLTIVAQGATLAGARGRALVNAERVQFAGRAFRDDIGAKEFA